MTLVQLRHFVALAESGSFSRSAQALFLTQPALSRSIRALEEELGEPLLERLGRRSELTPFGREALQRAQALLDGAQELAATAPRMRAGQAGGLRLGLGSGAGAVLMEPLLLHMVRLYPAVHFAISRGHTELLVQALRERKLDALVIDARSMVPAPDLVMERVWSLPAGFLCRPGHPLLASRRPLRFAEVARYPIASTPLSDEVARVLVERYGAQAHPDECVTARCEEIASLVALAGSTDAVLLAIEAAAPQLRALRITPPLDDFARFGFVTLRGRREVPTLALAREAVVQIFARARAREEAGR